MLAAHLALATVTAVVYGTLAIMLGRRRTDARARSALNLFRVWWFALAVITALDPLEVALLTFDALPIWVYETMREASLLVLSAGLWGLLCYLIYAYRGDRRAWRPLAAVYCITGVALLGILNRGGTPEALVIQYGEVDSVPGLQLTTSATAMILLLLVGPQIIAAAAYARLYWRADTPTQQYRIALVSFALLGWLGSSVAGAVLEAEGGAWQYATRVLGLLAALLVMAAYFPPRFVRQRYGIRALGHEPVSAVNFTQTSHGHGHASEEASRAGRAEE